MTSTLYFFADTNLFVQCKPLSELDWSEWSEFDEIHLLVSRPVQAEIDSQKGKGSGRLARRARAASSFFREILLSKEKFREVRSKKPIVRIFLRQDLKWDPSLADQLSYEERDDQLVGTARLFAESHPGYSVRLLTHDTGPMTSAQMVGLQFEPIPDDWLLAPEADEMEKRVNQLQAELTRFKKSEPSFEATFKNDATTDDATLDFKFIFYSGLDEAQIAELVSHITAAYPLSSDFGSPEPDERTANLFSIHLGKEIYHPATEAEITEYRGALYPAWIDKCTKIFYELHATLNARLPVPQITARAKNVGGRPADSALITFTAVGGFQILPRPSATDDSQAKPAVVLPPPPIPPQGRWEWNHGSAWEMIEQLGKHSAPFLPPSGMDYARSLPLFPKPVSDDPNAFYYKPNRPRVPTGEISLECSQWRHHSDEESFRFEIHVQYAPGVVYGALKVRIEAANVTEPFIQTSRVQIDVSEISVLDEAYRLINALPDQLRS
ncbi:hypothetical protein R69746_07689 [Paraburkholderia aspalathi]|uniref:PIN domain-containing protein n=1 Tax=Paraburkholderia aspalathi TaxID=1324617 RepID=UPI0019092789|nr:PIN domain-containing protein [Paraburkholderia aspalathi]MBK3843678.1 hypothetical protein [Paraburkholderia aspalathi]CAE6858323.1 hypothetical protein R69746_07689 [Paraburkholderia aspalathi]